MFGANGRPRSKDVRPVMAGAELAEPYCHVYMPVTLRLFLSTQRDVRARHSGGGWLRHSTRHGARRARDLNRAS